MESICYSQEINYLTQFATVPELRESGFFYVPGDKYVVILEAATDV